MSDFATRLRNAEDYGNGHLEKLHIAAAEEIDRLTTALSEAEQRVKGANTGWVFAEGDIVRKKSGSWWEGCVVGTYSTAQTPKGYCVQLIVQNGPVQIYPENALELVALAGEVI